MRNREFSVAMTETVDANLRKHLLRVDRQEDLCFVLWRPSTGRARSTALLAEIILPRDGDRQVHGNASFNPPYFERAVAMSRQTGYGIAFLHSHPGARGWQGMSADDIAAETRIAGAVLGATALPLVGLTRSRDAWSARTWQRIAPKRYHRIAAHNVRVVGRRLSVSVPYRTARFPDELERTVSVWGTAGQHALSSLTIGIAGLGSVGSAVAEILARMGIFRVVFVDFDRMELRNFDRQSNANRRDVGEFKVDIAARAYTEHASALPVDVHALPYGCDEEQGYRALLGCDVIFSCVDRPWPRRILNELSYANLIPVVDGGIRVRKRRGRFVGADWHVHTAGPERRCLQCWEAYDPADAAVDRDGLLDDPSYIAELDPNHPLVSRDNVFPFAVHAAAMETMQMAAMVVGAQPDLGDQNYHFSAGTIDHTPDPGCDDDCLYAAMTGLGDASMPPMRTRQNGRRTRAVGRPDPEPIATDVRPEPEGSTPLKTEIVR